LAAAAARDISAHVVTGFVDDSVSELLALDDQREAPLSLVALGDPDDPAVTPAPKVEPLAPETVPCRRRKLTIRRYGKYSAPPGWRLEQRWQLGVEKGSAFWRGKSKKQLGACFHSNR
jgi:hypothetical protein